MENTIIEVITTFGPIAGIATCVIYYFATDKLARYPGGVIRVEDEFILKNNEGCSAKAKVKFIVRCELADNGEDKKTKDKEEEKDKKKNNAAKLSGIAAMMFAEVLAEKDPRKKINLKQIKSESAKRFLAMEKRINNPRKIVSARFKIISFELSKIEKLK